MNDPNKQPAQNTPTVIEEFIRKIAPGREHALQVFEQIVGEGEDAQAVKVLAIQNRQLNPEPPQPPQRAESPRRNHLFHDVAGFADYLAKYKTDDTVVLANVPELTIRAVLDERAEEGFEVLTLRPACHPLFVPWAELLERDDAGEDPMPIERFAEFVMANRRAVQEPDARELVLTLSQVRASRKITVDRGRGMKSINGVVVETVIEGQSRSDIIALPETLTIEVPLFIRTAPRRIEIDLLAVASDANVYMRAVSADVEEAKVDAFEEMLTAVKAIEGVIVATGEPGHDTWDYLK